MASNSSVVPPANLDFAPLERTIGVYFISYIFMTILYGFTFFQTYVYFSRYYNDHLGMKALVSLTCLIDTVATALLSHSLYFYTIVLFPTPLGFDLATREYVAATGLAAACVLLSQMVYAFMIWHNRKNAVSSIVNSTLAVVGFGFGVAFTVHLSRDTDLSKLGMNPAQFLMTANQVFVAAAALVSFISLSFSSPTPTEVEESWYDILVKYAIARGGLVTFLQICYLVVFVAAPAHRYWLPFYLVANKFFINSSLTLLNCRYVHMGKGIDSGSVALQESNTWHQSSEQRPTASGFTFKIPVARRGQTETTVQDVVDLPKDKANRTLTTSTDLNRSFEASRNEDHKADAAL